MELTEPIETINKRLLDYFGKFEDGRPKFRIVWANDELETRRGVFAKLDAHGNKIGEQEGFELKPKYNYMMNTYMLEMLLGVPDNVDCKLTTKSSYEPIHAFRDRKGNQTPPKFEVCQILIQTILRKAAQVSGKKYEEKELQTKEAIMERINILTKELYGNETDIGDALAHGSGVGYTPPPKIIEG